MLDVWDRVAAAVKADQKKRPRRPPSRPAAPRPAPAAPARDPIARAARQVGRTATRAGSATNTGVGRAVAQTPNIRSVRRVARPQNVDPEYAAIRREIEAAKRSGALSNGPRPAGPNTGGITPEMAGVFRARGLSDAGNEPLGWLRNVGGDAMEIVTGIPASGQLIGENLAAFGNPLIWAARGADEVGVPGSGWVSDYQGRVGGMNRRAASAIKDDYAYRYGPLLRGDWDEAWDRFKDDPLFFALDAAGAKAAVGRAPSGLARATRTVAPRSRAAGRMNRKFSPLTEAEREIVRGVGNVANFVPGDGGLVRAPRIVRGRADSGPEPGRPAPPPTEVAIRRSYSRDFINRGVQRGVDRLSARVTPKREAKAEKLVQRRIPSQPPGLVAATRGFFAEGRTPQGKYEKFQRRETLDKRDIAEARADSIFNKNSKAATRALNKLRPDRNEAGVKVRGISAEQVVAQLYLDDIINVDGPGRGGRSNLDIAKMWVKTVEARQRQQQIPRRPGDIVPEMTNAKAQVAKVREAIGTRPELFDPAAPGALRVVRAVQEGRRLDRISQAQSVRSGVITNATRKEVATRASALTVGGSRWWADAAADVRKRYRPQITTLRRKLAAANARGDTKRAKEIRAKLADVQRKSDARVAAIKRQSTRETPELRRKREEFAASDRRLREDQRGGSGRDVSAATRARDDHRKQLQRMEEEARGFTPPRRPELVGKRGVYVRDTFADPSSPPKPSTTAAGMAPPKVYRSKGRMKSAALMDMNPNLLVHQARRATAAYTGRISPKAFKELMDTAAFKDAKGQWITGDRMQLMRGLDMNRTRLVSVKALQTMMKRLDELEDGNWVPEREARALFLDDISLLPKGAPAKDYVAISKAAADVWTEAMTTNKGLRALDTAMNWWKGGVLTLTPKWYVNNSFGLALQYGLMTGGDVRGVVRANRLDGPIRQAITKRSPQAVMDTLADELLNNPGSLPKMLRWGFTFNGKLEEFWRRASYYNRAKGEFAREGVRLSKLDDATAARAIENMPEAMANRVVRDLDFFIGNYRKFNWFERKVMKRVLPFYSWLRVIARLTFVLPFRSPTRVLALGVLAKAQEAGINPVDSAFDFYERGALRFGDLAVPTWSLNPWQSLAPIIAAIGDEHPLGAFLEENVGWTHPLIQFAYSQSAGTNAFGQGLITPPGTKPYGRGKKVWNEATQSWRPVKSRIPMLEAMISTVAPAQVALIRNAAGGDRTPYPQVTTAELLGDLMNRVEGGERNEKLYMPKSKREGRKASPWNPLTKTLGAPVYKQDDAAVVREFERESRETRAENKKLDRQRERG